MSEVRSETLQPFIKNPKQTKEFSDNILNSQNKEATPTALACEKVQGSPCSEADGPPVLITDHH